MTISTYHYDIIVDVDDVTGESTAFLDGRDSPLRGHGESPLQAIRALCETLREWPIIGADQWLTTDTGVALARQFVPGFEAGKSDGKA